MVGLLGRGHNAPQFRTRATVKIQEGCNRRCTYCVVPFVRGQPRSEPYAAVIREIRMHLREGYREIVLAGTHLGSYQSGERDLVKLLDGVLALKGDFRIRLSSLEPAEVTASLIEMIAHHPKLCPHLHLSLQSLCDSVLRNMKRDTPFPQIERLLNRIHNKDSGIRIGTDLIAGFPTETRTDFKQTLQRAKILPLHYGHVFRFSARPHTEAGTWPQKVPGKEITERSRALRDCLQKKHLAFQRAQTGTIRRVLIEDTKRKSGLTDNYLRMRIRGRESLETNRFYSAKITGSGLREVVGELAPQIRES